VASLRGYGRGPRLKLYVIVRRLYGKTDMRLRNYIFLIRKTIENGGCTMFNHKIWIFGLLLLGLVMVPSALATQPAELKGYFDEFVPGEGDIPTVYCLHTGEEYGVPDGFLDGCVVQPNKPGLAQKGIFTGHVGEKEGTCEYSLRTFDLDGIARGTFYRCTGDLAGLHLKAVGWTNGFWEGSYHFDP
jgi:hypothetical protein